MKSKILVAGFILLVGGIAVAGWHEHARSEFLADRLECVRHGEMLMLGGTLPYQPCLGAYIGDEDGPPPWADSQPWIAFDRAALWLRGYEPWDSRLEHVKFEGERRTTYATCFGANCSHVGQADGLAR